MVTATASPSSATSYNVNWDALSAATSGLLSNVPPQGARTSTDTCTPPSAHPYPVVLVHGVYANQNVTWQAVAPMLATEGYCVYTITYGQTGISGNFGGLDNLNTSASELSTFVNQVLSSTGAAKVDIVAHSEGANISRLYIKNDGGQSKVHSYVSIGGVNMGPPTANGLLTYLTVIPGFPFLWGVTCPACQTLTSDQNYFNTLNNPATYSGINYYVITSNTDEVVNPVSLQGLPNASNVVNIAVQDYCPNDHVGHLGEPYDKWIEAVVEASLNPGQAGPTSCDTRSFTM
jgi:hypothetical protein